MGAAEVAASQPLPSRKLPHCCSLSQLGTSWQRPGRKSWGPGVSPGAVSTGSPAGSRPPCEKADCHSDPWVCDRWQAVRRSQQLPSGKEGLSRVPSSWGVCAGETENWKVSARS